MKNSAVAALLVSTLLQGCGSPGAEGGSTIAGQLQSEMRQTRRLIEQEIGGAPAQSVQQCRTLPLGAKACGGPHTYLVYSTAASSEQKLRELAREYAEAEQKYNRVTEAMSTCSYLMAPDVHLVNGQCKARASLPGQKPQ